MEGTPKRSLSENFRIKKDINQRYGKRRCFYMDYGGKKISPYAQRFKTDFSRCDENVILEMLSNQLEILSILQKENIWGTKKILNIYL